MMTLDEDIKALHVEWLTLQDEYDTIHPKIREDAVYARIKAIGARQQEIFKTMGDIARGADHPPVLYVHDEVTIYMEHAKLNRVKDKSQAIGEFLDWLSEQRGIALCKYDPAHPPYWPIHKRTEQLLAEFFQIDLKKIEDEKRAMLASLQENST